MIRKSCAVLALLSLAALPSLAMQRSPQPLPQALSEATQVVHATVESTDSIWAEDEWGRHIWTTYTLRVAQTLKGSLEGDELAEQRRNRLHGHRCDARGIGDSLGKQRALIPNH